MPGDFIRIFSDLHYGDRASRVHRLAQLRPLLDGVEQLVLNGDTLDTRRGPAPAYTEECRAAVLDFFPRAVPSVTFLTGNHDADFSTHHSIDLFAGEVFIVHGDILFDEIVPWGRDGPAIGRGIAAGLRTLPVLARDNLEHRLAVWRQVAASIPQRHQAERHSFKYILRFAADTIWPPLRILWILNAWRVVPERAAQLVRRHRPRARFVLIGHTHRPGVWHMPGGVVVVNTGSFCPPLGGCVVDVTATKLLVRAVDRRAGEFRAGAVRAEFRLAGA